MEQAARSPANQPELIADWTKDVVARAAKSAQQHTGSGGTP
jgi:hypothetical protein